MVEKDIHKIFKELKHLAPDPAFTNRSRRIILSAKTKPTWADFFVFKNSFEVARLTLTVGATAVLIFSIFGGVSYINQRFSPLPAGLGQGLVTEAEEVNNSIQIALDEINYLDQNNSQAIRTMEKVAAAKPEELAEKEKAAPETTTSAEVIDQEIYNLLDQAAE